MGSFLSKPSEGARLASHQDGFQFESRKRPRISSEYSEENTRLIPSLPDEISLQILARLPRICYLNVKSVSKRWEAAVSGTEVFQLRKELGTTEEWLYILLKVEDDNLLWHALDPKSGRWQRLPPMPNIIYKEEYKRGASLPKIWNLIGSTIKIADAIKGWLKCKDALDRLPFCGCAIGSADGCVYVLGGFSRASAMRCVWKYDPRVNAWYEVSSMTMGRAYCKTAVLNDKLYAVGGVNRGRGGLTPLQSAEVYDPRKGTWTPVPSMPFSKAQVLPTAFLADIIKPIATGMTAYRGQLCVPQSLYTWPFFVDVGGEIYDPEEDCWVEMPAGMGEGWPARQAGTKLSVVVDGELYALDPSNSLYSGKVKVYDPQEDAWKVVISSVPIRDFTDSESPYLLAGFHGKLHVITKDAGGDTMVFQADMPRYICQASSSTSSSLDPSVEIPDLTSEGERDIWKAIAGKNFGPAELVSCQVLDI